jgi:DnaJ-class molecular chaperone
LTILLAYEVLSDDDLRQVYDRYGEDGVKQKQSGGGQQQNPFGDFFSQFFGGNQGNNDNQERIH